MGTFKRILVTGGAGYIGSHTVRALLDAGLEPIVLDNLSSGNAQALPEHVPLIRGEVGSPETLQQVFQEYSPGAVIHFAAFIEAGESMVAPARFYRNNVVNTLNLVDAMVAHDVEWLVFSSSAGVYGEPADVPIPEEAPKAPVNTYGKTKWVIEQVLADYDRAYGLRSVSLRYFNACGAHPEGDIGEAHPNKTHLIELALLAVLGKRAHMKVFGTDYPTADGTAIRDYIHVCDLAAAHLLTLEALRKDGKTRAYNVGLGKGYSVQEVLDSVDRVAGCTLPRQLEPRRPGDPAILVADSARIRTELGWRPEYTELDQIIATAWNWHRRHPDDFDAHPAGFGDEAHS